MIGTPFTPSSNLISYRFCRNAGIPPTYDTYTEILKGYATEGNIEKVKQTFADASAAEIPFFPSNIFDVVIEACQCGHREIVDEVCASADIQSA